MTTSTQENTDLLQLPSKNMGRPTNKLVDRMRSKAWWSKVEGFMRKSALVWREELFELQKGKGEDSSRTLNKLAAVTDETLSGWFLSELHEELLSNRYYFKIIYALIDNAEHRKQHEGGSPIETLYGNGVGQFLFWEDGPYTPDRAEVADRKRFLRVEKEQAFKESEDSKKQATLAIWEDISQALIEQAFKGKWDQTLWRDCVKRNYGAVNFCRTLPNEKEQKIDISKLRNSIFQLPVTVDFSDSKKDFEKRKKSKSRIQVWCSNHRHGTHHMPNTVIVNIFQFMGLGGKDILEHGPRDGVEYVAYTDYINKHLSLWSALGARDGEMQGQVKNLVWYLSKPGCKPKDFSVTEYYRRLNFVGQPIATLVAAILAWRMSADGILLHLRPRLQRRLSRILRSEHTAAILADQGIDVQELDSLLFGYIAEDGSTIDDSVEWELDVLRRYCGEVSPPENQESNFFEQFDIANGKDFTLEEAEKEILRLKDWKKRLNIRWGNLNDNKTKPDSQMRALMNEARLSNFTLDKHCRVQIEDKWGAEYEKQINFS